MALPRQRFGKGKIMSTNSFPNYSPGEARRSDKKTRRNYRNGDDPEHENMDATLLPTRPNHHQKRQQKQRWQRPPSNLDRKILTRERCYS
eukprot:6468822-Ditylum_brightwellii.AAC.1